MLSQFSQEKVSKAHIMVVGCGALGNEVVKNLVLMGVRHLVLVDFDHVEPDNLSRSVWFTKEDAQAGRCKVEAMADKLKQFHPEIELRTIYGNIAYDVGLGLIRRMDVIIGCVDNRWARYCINRLCMRAGKPWVDGGIDGLEGTARVFMPGENCYACNIGPEGLKDLTRRMPCAGIIRRNIEAGKAPTTSIVASIIGAVQVQEALKIIHNAQLPLRSRNSLAPPSAFIIHNNEFTSLCGKMFYYEGQHLTSKLVDFKAWDDDCALHECWEPVKHTALTTQATVAEALQQLKDELQTTEVSIRLTDDCFVDYVARRDNNKRFEVMKPGRAVATFVEENKELCGIPFSGLYQHEWRDIDNKFPYLNLTLGEIGIPMQAVLLVGDSYVELSENG